jgi:hypothetical protein
MALAVLLSNLRFAANPPADLPSASSYISQAPSFGRHQRILFPSVDVLFIELTSFRYIHHSHSVRRPCIVSHWPFTFTAPFPIRISTPSLRRKFSPRCGSMNSACQLNRRWSNQPPSVWVSSTSLPEYAVTPLL